ncbi:MAG: NHLP family bacteriocin export ABC transporter peptidase/permease/ATPase subunit [Marinobacter sp.]
MIFRRNRNTSGRARTPTILQMEAVECGAAALAIILAYYRKWVPLEELRVECGVNRDGSKASNLVKAARRYGMEAKGFRKSPEQIRELRLPVIVFWNFNHFLVVEGFRGDRVYLNDPAMGPRTVTWQEFDEGFTGVVLDIHPGEEFEPGGRKESVFDLIGERLQGAWPSVTFLLLVGLALVIPGLLTPVFTKVFVDNYLVGQLDSWVRPLLLGMAITAVVRILLGWLQENTLASLRTRLSVVGSSRFLWHVLHLPVMFYQQRSPGEISNRVAINDKVAGVLAGDVAESLLSVLTIGFYAALMLVFDVALTALAILIALGNVVVLRLMARQREDGSQRLLMQHGKLMGISMNGIRSIETLKASGTEDDFFAQWAGHHAKVTQSQQQLAASTLMLMAVPGLLTGLNTALILGFGGVRVMEGALTIGSLVAFQSLTQSFVKPVTQLVDVGGRLQDMLGDMRRLRDVMHHEPDPQTRPRDTTDQKPQLAGFLELKDLTFGFSPHEPPLIEQFNLRLNPGMRVALVGTSGCGKSTLSRLVMGLHRPWSGQVLFDGQPAEHWGRDVLANSVAMVDQDIAVFDGSIRDNLTLWDTTIGDEQLFRAARDALIHQTITSRRGGYQSSMEEGGRNFSGGQLQRLEIARALAGDPSVLVLDEATSALDTLSEQEIDDSLRRRGCTCLIVAHRLSTIRDCDEIIVLDHGKVVQRGTHDAMKDVDGPYRNLISTL